MTCNNPNLDLVKVNAYGKCNQIPLIHSQDTVLLRLKLHPSAHGVHYV